MTPAEYRARREAMGLSQADFAGLLGLTQTTIWRRERPGTLITLEMERALERVEEMIRSGAIIV